MHPGSRQSELVIITGLSGSGKGTVLKCFEDMGYYAVDNLPLDLFPKFAELTKDAPNIRRAALVVDIREGETLKRFPALYQEVSAKVPTKLIFLDADDSTLVRRFSETRRPHPLGKSRSVLKNVQAERALLEELRSLSTIALNTSKFNGHELRALIEEQFLNSDSEPRLAIHVSSFGFRHGIQQDADLVFDVRFLPNPNYIPEFKPFTGRHPSVARYIRSFPQTQEFLTKVCDMLSYLLPHYIKEGKSYLTIAFGCTGGQHRSVMIAEEVSKRLKREGYPIKVQHRDSPSKSGKKSV
ncbi:RNase adapter RapZ [Bryobacter aggregatus]|uniref:RNase adapter RapZ n=1 Tax=Bryobacter aggregatus TaxID=360054 RepID=UPI000B076A9C|nr:RNase adapter RapZ [Bryobacter aggregatus]